MIDAYDKPARTMLTSEESFSRTTHIVKDKATGRINKTSDSGGNRKNPRISNRTHTVLYGW